jgi:DNA polymerase-3 subunit gamma/tau
VPSTDDDGWATSAPEPESEAEPAGPTVRPARTPPAPAALDSNRYGEAVVREVLKATFIEEQPHTPRVIPRGD